MADPWRAELWRIAGLLFAGLLLGALTGRFALGLLIALVPWFGWYLYNTWRLWKWFHLPNKTSRIPVSVGIWGALFENILSLQLRNRKRKKDLRRMLKRFHKITMALPDAAVELHPDSEEIDWWNQAAARQLGFSYPRDSGQRINNLLRFPEFQEYLRNENYADAIEMPSPVDENIQLLVRIIPYWSGRRLVIAQDMTRMQILEKARQNFVANVSHELRTPLTVVTGYLESIQEDDEVSQRYGSILASMHIQTGRMNRIVTDLLTLSQLESGMVTFDTVPVPVPALIELVCRDARSVSAEAGHVFNLDVDKRLCISGIESEIHSAFSNLVVNAVRYTPSGGRIDICWTDTPDGPEFSVRDSGIGIAPEHIPRITERFYRVDVGRSRAKGGTGLGLAIVKHVLLRHRARLRIDSEPETGSTFRCSFPPELRVDCDAG